MLMAGISPLPGETLCGHLPPAHISRRFTPRLRALHARLPSATRQLPNHKLLRTRGRRWFNGQAGVWVKTTNGGLRGWADPHPTPPPPHTHPRAAGKAWTRSTMHRALDAHARRPASNLFPTLTTQGHSYLKQPSTVRTDVCAGGHGKHLTGLLLVGRCRRAEHERGRLDFTSSSGRVRQGITHFHFGNLVCLSQADPSVQVLPPDSFRRYICQRRVDATPHNTPHATQRATTLWWDYSSLPWRIHPSTL